MQGRNRSWRLKLTTVYLVLTIAAASLRIAVAKEQVAMIRSSYWVYSYLKGCSGNRVDQNQAI